jgi:hypothetical protein
MNWLRSQWHTLCLGRWWLHVPDWWWSGTPMVAARQWGSPSLRAPRESILLRLGHALVNLGPSASYRWCLWQGPTNHVNSGSPLITTFWGEVTKTRGLQTDSNVEINPTGMTPNQPDQTIISLVSYSHFFPFFRTSTCVLVNCLFELHRNLAARTKITMIDQDQSPDGRRWHKLKLWPPRDHDAEAPSDWEPIWQTWSPKRTSMEEACVLQQRRVVFFFFEDDENLQYWVGNCLVGIAYNGWNLTHGRESACVPSVFVAQ